MFCPGGVGWHVGLGLSHRLVALEIEDLGHGGSHTAGHRPAKGEVHGALIVVGGALVPLGGQHGLNDGMGGHLLSDWLFCGLQVGDVVGITVEPGAHIVGNSLVVELTRVCITQYAFNLVVGGYKNIALVHTAVESIVRNMSSGKSLGSGSQLTAVGHRSKHKTATLGLQILLGFLSGLLTGNGVCYGAKREKHAQRKERQS